MGNVALIFDSPGDGFTLQPAAAGRLADLGVTRVSLLRDGGSIAVVLDGWAFDAMGSVSEVEKALFGGTGRARVFRELVQMSLSRP